MVKCKDNTIDEIRLFKFVPRYVLLVELRRDFLRFLAQDFKRSPAVN